MKNLTNTQVFLAVFDKWRKKNKIRDIKKKIRKNISHHAAICHYEDDKKMYLEYCPKNLNAVPLGVAINMALHEIGHLINQMPYDTFSQIVKSELKAELYAIKVMKKYFPKLYLNQVIRWTKKKLSEEKFCKKETDHALAYAQIKEYTT